MQRHWRSNRATNNNSAVSRHIRLAQAALRLSLLNQKLHSGSLASSHRHYLPQDRFEGHRLIMVNLAKL